MPRLYRVDVHGLARTDTESHRQTRTNTARYSRNQILSASERKAGLLTASHVKRCEQRHSAGEPRNGVIHSRSSTGCER